MKARLNDKKALDSKNLMDENPAIKIVNKFVESTNEIELDSASEFRKNIKCTRYNGVYGPVYWGTIKLSDFKFWDNLISENKVTEEEKDIIIGMAANEGNLDSVQSYDSEIMTVGAMQKTVNIQGMGQFYQQVLDFKNENKEMYETLFVKYGWNVENGKMNYNGKSGKDLKDLISEHCEKGNFGKTVRSTPLEPLISACNEESFQIKQVLDFIKALKDVLHKKPSAYSFLISDFIKTRLGKATVLDQYINRPGYVAAQ